MDACERKVTGEMNACPALMPRVQSANVALHRLVVRAHVSMGGAAGGSASSAAERAEAERAHALLVSLLALVQTLPRSTTQGRLMA